jgi:DNA polymerase-4
VNQVRKIIHIDMDAFYASVEQRDNPSLRGKPLVVGATPNQRGVVAAASYEARKYGIHSAMPSRIAIAKCPHLIFTRPRFEVYREVLGKSTPSLYATLIYLNQLPYASTVARHIRADIFRETNLTASAGVSVNKFLAKMASGKNKPNGMTVILPENAQTFFDMSKNSFAQFLKNRSPKIFKNRVGTSYTF